MLDAAESLCTQLLAHQPRLVEAFEIRSSAHQRRGQFDQAAADLQRAAGLRPGNPQLRANLANALFRAGRLDESEAVCDDGLARWPEKADFMLVKATCAERRGRYDDALELLHRMPAHEASRPESASIAAKALHGLKRYDESISIARSALKASAGTPVVQRQLWFQLFKTYDAMGEFDRAMAAVHAAHAVERNPFDPSGYRKRIDAIIGAFTPASMKALPRAANESQTPVFVIGMPRSGTSLIEQIISVHPDAFGAGELPDVSRIAASLTARLGSFHVYPECICDLTQQVLDESASFYLARLAALAPGAKRVVDKALEQYENIGLIAMLFPRARIIHCIRDPLDTCLSCYTRPMNPGRVPYVADLSNLGLVYRQHQRVMEHWKQTIDLPILTVQYEDLVRSQEAQTRKIIAFLGLEWDDRCLHYYRSDRPVMTLSYDQVNQPIYDSSIGRWRHYERHLEPLQQSLRDGIVDS